MESLPNPLKSLRGNRGVEGEVTEYPSTSVASKLNVAGLNPIAGSNVINGLGVNFRDHFASGGEFVPVLLWNDCFRLLGRFPSRSIADIRRGMASSTARHA